jgi:hypothetical protein
MFYWFRMFVPPKFICIVAPLMFVMISEMLEKMRFKSIPLALLTKLLFYMSTKGAPRFPKFIYTD